MKLTSILFLLSSMSFASFKANCTPVLKVIIKNQSLNISNQNDELRAAYFEMADLKTEMNGWQEADARTLFTLAAHSEMKLDTVIKRKSILADYTADIKAKEFKEKYLDLKRIIKECPYRDKKAIL